MRKKEKSVDDYRRDIFTLKLQIKEQEKYLQQLNQKHSQIDVFCEQSYTFQMKMKILECNLTDIKHKIQKYSRQQDKQFYQINFCVYALMRAAQVVGISLEMVFRGVDVEQKGEINYLDLVNFFREVLRLNSNFINPIMKLLDPQDSTKIGWPRYYKFLSVFILNSQKMENQFAVSPLTSGVQNVAKQFIIEKLNVKTLWKSELLNIATTIGPIKRKFPNLDILDCVAVYCRCDPNKEGMIKNETVCIMMEQRINDLRHFSQNLKLKKK